MKSNWLEENSKQIEYYLSSKDVILIERARQLKMMLEIFESYFEKREGLDFLDFGCGDGALSKVIYNKYPKNRFHLLDGSATMLEKAKKNFPSEGFTYTGDSFENFIERNKDERKYDFIFSSMAIHHLEYDMKLRLFSKFYLQLKYGGLFINIDVVQPVSRKTEEIQFEMWEDYIRDELKRLGRESEISMHENLSAGYKVKLENKPSLLSSQLHSLEQTGFHDVECYFKFGIFAVFGGVKE